MYTTMTNRSTIEMPGYVVLVPSNSGAARDGCIWHFQHYPARIAAQPVRLVGGKPREPQQPLWDEHFLDTADLLEAMNREGKEEIDRLIHVQLDDEKLAEKVTENPAAYVCAQLASGLKGAQFVVWWRDREQRLDVGVYCENPRAAAYAHLLAYGAQPFPVGKCPECRKRFVRNRWHPKTYCSTRCRNTHNVRESRNRKRTKLLKSQSRKSGGRSKANVTRKTR
jgi:hypothetical protein